ncbi:MAG: sugar phosphate nucleotidyltransferase [Pseudomonadota bacterium]
MAIYPFIMAGGLGKRLAPISTPETPKQFLKLNSEQTMLQETLARLEVKDFETPCIISNQKHEKLIAQQLGDESNHQIILEAEGRGTAFAIGIAALCAIEKNENALILMLPCDHVIESHEAFYEAVKSGLPHAKQGSLVVLGAKPTHPETGFGYIETDEHAHVCKFTEKPDIETAQQFIQNENMLWNTGMFLFPALKILDELKTHAPEVSKAAQESWRSKTQKVPHRIFTKQAH